MTTRCRPPCEGKAHFHQCARCGRWVCPEVCWNEAAGQCKECAGLQQELVSADAQADADAARQQLYDKAQQTDFVSDINMKKGSVVNSGGAKPGTFLLELRSECRGGEVLSGVRRQGRVGYPG